MASGFVTKEIESRLKQSPEHIFEVFLEIHQEASEISIKYPADVSDEIIKTAVNFAYPCQTAPDDQSENFTFVILDSTGLTFRYGYCRRSNRDSTCLCIISYYPWFEMFYNILNDLSRLINSKSMIEVERFLSFLYNYKLMSIKEFYRNQGKELIEMNNLFKYSRPDQRKLPSMLSNLNFTVMFSRLSSDIMLHLFAHLLFERRILFISSKLFHLTACACGCLDLINPMHWQSIFLPILPESLIWTTQCTAPYIIGIHSSIYSRMTKNDLGDVVIVNIDDRTIESSYDDLNCFPKSLIRKMKKEIQQSSQLIGDHLARVFLRTMASIFGNYANGFVIKNGKLDFDRDVYLQQYVGSDLHTFMTLITSTQMFEQFSRYRTYAQLEREIENDEFEMEVKKIQQSKKPKTNKKNQKTLEKATDPPVEQVQNKARKLQTEQRVIDEAPSIVNDLVSSNVNDVIQQDIESHEKLENPFSSSNYQSKLNRSSPKLDEHKTTSLLDLATDENPLLPSPIVLNEVKTPVTNGTLPPQVPQIDSKIKQLQSELQYKVQTFANKRLDPRDEYGEQRKEIKKLVQQFNPLPTSTPITFRADIHLSDRHPSIHESIPTNCVTNVLKNLQSNTRKDSKPMSSSATNNFYSHPSSSESNLVDFN